MPKCTDGTMELGRVGRRVIEANFEGGDAKSGSQASGQSFHFSSETAKRI
jgi:hypothetical protein